MLSKARRRSLPTLRQSRPSVFVRYSVIIYSKMLWRATIRTAWPRICWNSRCKRHRKGFLPKPVDSATVPSACSKEVVFQLVKHGAVLDRAVEIMFCRCLAFRTERFRLIVLLYPDCRLEQKPSQSEKACCHYCGRSEFFP